MGVSGLLGVLIGFRVIASWLGAHLPALSLEGLYVAHGVEMFTNVATKGTEVRPARTYVTLMRGGTVAQAFPTDATLTRVAGAALSALPPELKGIWRREGDRLLLRWGGGRPPEEWVIDRRGSGFFREGARFSRVRPFERKTIAGRYAFRSFNRTVSAGPAADLLPPGEAHIEFAPDGTFRERGFATFRGDSRIMDLPARRVPWREGRYVIEGFRLTLRYADGSSATLRIHADPGEEASPRPSVIVIEGYVFGAE